MKTPRIFALAGIFLTIVIAQPASAAYETDQINLGEHPCYVVIGAFSVHKNAIRFTGHANLKNMHAKFEMNPNRKLYYVYVLTTADKEQAIQEAQKLRAETEFTDTWVYSGDLGKMADGVVSRGVDIHPVTQKKMDDVPGNESIITASAGKENSNLLSRPSVSQNNPGGTVTGGENITPETLSENKALPAGEETTKLDDAVKTKSTVITGPDDDIATKGFVFKIFRAIDAAPVTGDVDIVDNEKSRKLATYKGNTEVRIPSPGNKSGEVALVCEVFGYRKIQRDINYKTPEGEGIAPDETGNTVIPFELIRLQKGDIAVMYNVYFFKDAGVMRPESRFEVNSLLEMLKENPKYKIKIHGHTNGGAAGKIVSMGKDSKNFFSLTDTRDGFGSAKKLSEERATVIRDYLISNGVEATRMQVKAWGGKRAIHDKHSARANENVRVEIEILEQ